MDHEYEIAPLKGVGSILLGMRREVSRNAMGTSPKTVRKSSAAESLTDAYNESAFQIFFDAKDAVEYIELSSGGPIPVIYKGIPVFETPADDLIEVISLDAPYDENDPELGYSYVFPLLELSVWRPVIAESRNDEDGRYFSTIGIGRKGYYSNRAI
jgi:hypothetical protein